MALPNYRYFIAATFAALAASSKPLRRRDLLEAAAMRFGVTAEQRREVIPSGRQLTYANRIGFALNALRVAGLAETVSHGVWQLSVDGQRVSERYPAGIPEGVAKEIDSQSSKASNGHRDENLDAQLTESEDALDAGAESRAVRAILMNNDEVARTLIDEMRKLPFEKFELLALNVLQRAGYGHDSATFEHTGKSGDGGIDGWLPLDRLGLQKVYIQAKRYKETNAVSASSVRDFLGAMLAKSARMGVFVTLSRFTEDARAAAQNVEGRTIELMDGENLAKLMIELEVGVSHEKLPPLAKFDRDYFEEL